jgi:hypothetical protein
VVLVILQAQVLSKASKILQAILQIHPSGGENPTISTNREGGEASGDGEAPTKIDPNQEGCEANRPIQVHLQASVPIPTKDREGGQPNHRHSFSFSSGLLRLMALNKHYSPDLSVTPLADVMTYPNATNQKMRARVRSEAQNLSVKVLSESATSVQEDIQG